MHVVYKYYTNMPCQHIFGLENRSTYLEPGLLAYTQQKFVLAQLPSKATNRAMWSVRISIYNRHTLIAWVWFLWSRPQTTSHVVLDRPRGNRRVKKTMREPNGHLHHYIWSSVLSMYAACGYIQLISTCIFLLCMCIPSLLFLIFSQVLLQMYQEGPPHVLYIHGSAMLYGSN